ncbi:hypothetical protein QQ045_009713 [Rhodiola kirilowii]
MRTSPNFSPEASIPPPPLSSKLWFSEEALYCFVANSAQRFHLTKLINLAAGPGDPLFCMYWLSSMDVAVFFCHPTYWIHGLCSKFSLDGLPAVDLWCIVAKNWNFVLCRTELIQKVAVVTLDPANDSLPYECAINIEDLIKLSDVMIEHSLGPNGGDLLMAPTVGTLCREL